MTDIEEELRHIEMLSAVLVENAKALQYCLEIVFKKMDEADLDVLSETSKQLDGIFKNSFGPDAINRFTGGLNP